MAKIVVIGGGGHAKIIMSIIKKINNFKIVGYTDHENRGNILGINYLGNDEVLRQVKRNYPSSSVVIGIGMLNNPNAQKRKKLFNFVTSLGFKLLPILSPDAVINENVKIGEGTIVMDGVIINSGTVIGDGVILNTNCSIDHDCKIGNFTHVAPGAILAGGVTIGENVLVGAGAIVIEYKTIADNILIGAGSVVTQDFTESGIYVGNPARLKS